MTKAEYFRELKKINDDFHYNFKQVFDFKTHTPESIKSYAKDKNSMIEILKLRKLRKDDHTDLIEYINENIKSLDAIPNIIYKMSLVYAISHFEFFLKKVTSLLLLYFWQSLKSKEKTINYDEVLSFESITDLKKYLIQKETNKISFGSIKDRIQYLENKLNIVFEYKKLDGIRNNWNSIELENLIEIHSTRNLIIHNNLIVNEMYLKDNPKSKLKKGEERIIDYKYVMDSFFVLFRVSFSINNIAKKKVQNKKTLPKV